MSDLTTTIRWTDGTETVHEWVVSAPWEAVKRARDRYALQASVIAEIDVREGPITRFRISNLMDDSEIERRMADAETGYRNHLANLNARFGGISGEIR